MSRIFQARSLNMQAFAQEGIPLIETIPLQNMDRLALESTGLQSDSAVHWRADGELRPNEGADDAVWVRLTARAEVSLTCQRCLGSVLVPLEVDQWYRFVATEEIAMAEDDQSEEDLLVMAPQFDLLAVLEDELLMALPLVPMHESCPVAPVLSVGEAELGRQADEKPNPFALLAQIKKK